MIESAVVESSDTLSVDSQRSAEALVAFVATIPEIISRETAFARSLGASLIVADIPFVAGLIAQQAGIPSIAAGNFTWDWIFEHVPAAAPSLETIRSGYRAFDFALRFPLSQPNGWEVFQEVRDVPLVTPRSVRPREEIRAELGITEETGPIVLIGGRALPDPSAAERLKLTCPEFLFLNNRSHPSFHDLVRAADLVVSKLGYSIAAECVAEGKRLLYPPRTGFREEELLATSLTDLVPCVSIPVEHWCSGDWRPWLDQLRSLKEPAFTVDCEGAKACAQAIVSQFVKSSSQ
ncbi:MAG: hypothetical protein H7Y20_00635 [Bryobacteraceae bacterium]|nr:hypothetical protein [Bryobacteraceae bacterium]